MGRAKPKWAIVSLAVSTQPKERHDILIECGDPDDLKIVLMFQRTEGSARWYEARLYERKRPAPSRKVSK